MLLDLFGLRRMGLKLDILLMRTKRMERLMGALTDAWNEVKKDIADFRARFEEIAAKVEDPTVKEEMMAVMEDMKKFDSEYDAEFAPVEVATDEAPTE